jgi:hypothetical protein
MATTRCRQFMESIEEWLEGERPADLRSHVRDCPNCMSFAQDLEKIRSEARSWRASETDAPERVWVALRLRLEQEGLIHDGSPVQQDRQSQRVFAVKDEGSGRGWLGGLFRGLPRPVLAGAYLAALVAIAFALSGPVNKRVNEARWLEGTRIATSPLSAQLNTAEQSSISSLTDSNPDVTASLHQNLAIVDNYIALCEKSVNEEPQNEVARDYLYAAYQQKADLLARMNERGDTIQ